MPEFAYKLVEIDVEPSVLWTTMANKADPAYFLDTSSVTNMDQEIDPRIKYYSNKANLNNVHNFQSQLIVKEQQQAQLEEQQQKQQQQQQAQIVKDSK